MNSDCTPNCEYDFTSDTGIVQLKVKRRISHGDDLFVKYGPEFFEFNSCLCRTCEISKTDNLLFEVTFDLLLGDLITDLADEELLSLRSDTVESPVYFTEEPVLKKRRIRGRELIEIFNAATSSPLSTENSPKIASDESSMSCADTESVQESEDESPTSSYVLTDSDCDVGSEKFSPSIKRIFPVPNIVYPSLEKSGGAGEDLEVPPDMPDLSDSEISFSHCIEETSSSVTEKLFDGSELTAEETAILTDLLCSRFNLSDVCASSIHSLIKAFLPSDNCFPSGYSHIKKIKQNFQEQIRCFRKKERYSFCVLNFRFQLRFLVQKNLPAIFKHSVNRQREPNSDFNSNVFPFVKKDNNGAIKKSTMRKELWPIWVQIADLPPRLRMSQKNIVLAALFVGGGRPDWFEIVPFLKGELLSSVEVYDSVDNCTISVPFKVRVLVSDLGAKSSMAITDAIIALCPEKR